MIRIIFFVFLLTYLYSESISKEMLVCKECIHKSIKDAISLSNPYDTIIVQEGINDEFEININYPIYLFGNKATIDANLNGGIFNIYSDNVSISGFTLINIKESFKKDIAAIYVFNVNNFSLENLTIRNPFFAFLIQKSSRGYIRNNIIIGNAENQYNSANGIHIWHSNNIEVINNKISNMRDGIYFEFVKNSTIRSNNSTNNLRYGLHFMFSDNNEYDGNTFERNGAGVAVMFSKKIIMKNNYFLNNWGSSSYGLLLKEIYDSEIRNNLFDNNTIGINIEGSTRINYYKNTFLSNGWAVKVLGGCYNNLFMNNNFISNSFDLSYNGSENDNLFKNNYWSKYSGYDLDTDGIGDVPFHPVKLFSFVVDRSPESIILLRSLFVEMINFSENVSPIFTPTYLVDKEPLIKIIK